MSRWDVQPIGVLGTLSTTGDAAGRLEDAVNSMVKNLASASSSAGTVVQGSAYTPSISLVGPGTTRSFEVGPAAAPTGPVAAALNQYLVNRQKKLAAMANRTANAITGAAEATNWYQQGNLEMAATSQAKALQAPDKVDLPGAGGERGPK